MSQVRINKYLAHTGLASRRQIDEYIDQGRVIVNDQPADLGMKIDPGKDEIKFDGKLVSQTDERERLVYWKVYKPVGVVSTADDPYDRPTVVDLIDIGQRVYPVGRLDQESEGLVLLTNDGELTYKLTHPQFHVPKVYIVWLRGDLTDKKIKQLRTGVKLKEGVTKAAEIVILARHPQRSMIKITLFEGQNRQIRRMSGELGMNVDRLKRVKIGDLELGDLESGEAEPLTVAEVEHLTESAY